MGKRSKRILVFCLITALMISCMGTAVFAKTRKVKPDSRSYTSSVKKAEKRAEKVKKGTQVIVLPSSGRAYLKFVAHRTGDYYFSVSNVEKKKGHSNARGILSFMKTQKESYKYLRYVSVGTYGGRNTSLNFSDPEMKLGVTKSSWYLTERTGRMHLKNGETVYLYIQSTIKSFNLRIKEK